MESIIQESTRAIGLLFGAFLIYHLWKFAYESSRSNPPFTIAWQGALYCIGAALFMSMTLGDPTCIDFESDLRGGTCYEYSDDSFDPSFDERAGAFAYWVTMFYLPVIFGAYAQKNHRPKEHYESEA